MKPGDLCIVMGARNTPGLDGRIVELARPHVPGNEYRAVSSRYIVRGTGGWSLGVQGTSTLTLAFQA